MILTKEQVAELAEREKGLPFDKLTKCFLVVDLQKGDIYYLVL